MSSSPAKIKILKDNSHILLRPEMYVGSVQKEEQPRWLYENGKIVNRKVEIIPALLKLFDEVISNSVDEAIKTEFKYSNKISVFIMDNSIEVKDNGRGLDIEFDEEYQEYTSALAFIKLRAGSNFEDDKNQISIGRFGVGVSLTNIFSKFFEVDSINTNGQQMKFEASNNNSKYDVKIKMNANERHHGTTVKYTLDFGYFKISEYDAVHKGLIYKRIYDLAMNFPLIDFKLNGQRVKANDFKDYVRLVGDEFVIHDDGYNLAVLPYPVAEHISFINGIETLRGGSHVDLITSLICNNLRELIRKKHKIEVKPADIRNKILIILTANGIINAKFDSQTKERFVGYSSDITDIFKNIPDSFYKKILHNEAIITPIVEDYLMREKWKDEKKVEKKGKKLLKKKIPKLIDAKSENRQECTIFLTEGDSAASTFIVVADKNYHACMPLRGKVINVLNAKDKKIIANKEYQDILAATGLHLNKQVEDLRYGKIVILTDMDEDGSAITALLINFFYKYWPELFDAGIIRKYLSPLIIASKRGHESKRFYTLNDFHKFDATGWNIEYFKGLGSLSEEEYSTMINKPVEYIFTKDEATAVSIDIAFGPSADKRKVWLSE